MSITHMSTFVAQVDKQDQLRTFLQGIVPGIVASPGCQSCQVLRNPDRPERFVVVEVWTDVDAHKASVKQIPPASIAAVMPLLAGPPTGEYLQPV
jgi:quinol monooxygenase YgiN